MTVDLSDVNAVIEKNMAAFDKPGVLSVRPGFKVTKDWLTNTKSIVVTVRHKFGARPGRPERTHPAFTREVRQTVAKATETAATPTPPPPHDGEGD